MLWRKSNDVDAVGELPRTAKVIVQRRGTDAGAREPCRQRPGDLTQAALRKHQSREDSGDQPNFEQAVLLFLPFYSLPYSLTNASVMLAPMPALPPVTIADLPASMSLLQGKGGCSGGALPAAIPRFWASIRTGPRKRLRIDGTRPKLAML